jgi:hypothetical protein
MGKAQGQGNQKNGNQYLARAAHYILRDQVPFMPEKLFA